MTAFEFFNLVNGLDEFDLAELEGETCVDGPWASSYIFRIKVNGPKGPVGIVGELGMDDEKGTVEGVVDIKAYDLSGCAEDANVDDGEEIPDEGDAYEPYYDCIAERMGFDLKSGEDTD